MTSYTIGVDCGSSATKAVLMADKELLAKAVVPTSWSPKETVHSIIQNLKDQVDVDWEKEEAKVIVTGYGRVSIDFADKAVTEITCHGQGANYLYPGVRTVIDIGGQDAKVVSVLDGRVVDFLMNDKCAAGTGRFVEMSANRMGVDLYDFPSLLEAGKSTKLSSTCAVFADSEIISLLAAGNSREEIAGGIIAAVVHRVMTLTARVKVESPVMLTGGLAGLEGLKKELENQIGMEVHTSPLSRYAGAIGAALIPV